jgi:hypothetical protein
VWKLFAAFFALREFKLTREGSSGMGMGREANLIRINDRTKNRPKIGQLSNQQDHHLAGIISDQNF